MTLGQRTGWQVTRLQQQRELGGPQAEVAAMFNDAAALVRLTLEGSVTAQARI